MKRKIIFILFIAVTPLPCSAQWKNAGYNPGEVFAFGVHDSELFLSLPGHLYRYKNGEADNGIDFSSANVTSFAALGHYFFANTTANPYAYTYQSSDNGSHWHEVKGGLGVTSDSSHLFGTYQYFQIGPYIAISHDSGLTWDSVANFNGGSYATTFATNGACVFANISTSLWRSLDTGARGTWSQLSPPFLGTMMVMDSLLFITGTTNGSIIESTDSGSNWNPITVDSGSVKEHVNCLATDGKNLFAGTTSGIFLSTDEGKSWSAQNAGLPGIFDVVTMGVFDTLLFVDISPGYYAFFRPIPEMAPKSTVQQPLQPSTTLSVYPNPLTNAATISYTLAENARVNITIYDALGKTVSVPVPGYEETTGEHEITYDARSLPSGTYWCHLTAGSVEVSAKLVIEK